MNRITPIKTPEQIKQDKSFFYTPFYIAPNKTIFSERAERFKTLALADKTEWRAYLELLAAISEAQQIVYESNLDKQTLPTEHIQTNQILPSSDGSFIPSNTQEALLALIEHLADRLEPELVEALQALTKEQVEQIAKYCLNAEDSQLSADDKAFIIWVQSALQTIWTAWAYHLEDDDVPPVEERSHCPCCGSDAVSSVIKIETDLSDLRYMHCPTCNSQWNALRAKCTFCGDQSSIILQSIEGVDEGVLKGAHAETCDHCHSYRKLFTRRKQEHADPIADDIASLAVDILIGENGYQRGGRNPFLLDDPDEFFSDETVN